MNNIIRTKILKNIFQEKQETEAKNIQQLREEFDKKIIRDIKHPKTSYGKRNFIKYNDNNTNIQNNNMRWKTLDDYININNLKAKEKNNSFNYNYFIYKNRNISRNNPGYLYYKEIVNMNRTLQNKTRSFSGNNIFSKNKNNTNLKKQKSRSTNNIFIRNKKKLKLYSKKNKTSIDINIKNNNIYYPYMPTWVNKIISFNNNNTNSYNKKLSNFIPMIQNKDKNDIFVYQTYNKNNFELYKKKDNLFNNYLIRSKKIKKEKNKISNIGNINNINNMNNEHQKQFYPAVYSFFQNKNGIIEEPEYLEEDS